ncbi:MAG: hypothetical protein DELT_01448 [Desulfovibrio sp.]
MPTLRDLGHSQQFDWGSIRWLVDPGPGGVERISAGFLTFNARSRQDEHTHVGYEQAMYIISGHGRHEVNGESSHLLPGSLIHIPPFARHTMFNDTDEPLTLVSLYFPLRSHNVLAAPEKVVIYEDNGDDENIWSFLDMEALGDLLEKLSEALRFRFALLDAAGMTLIDTGNAPEFCTTICTASKGRLCRQKILAAIREREKTDTRGRIFTCCHSVLSMLIPVLSNKKIVGYIKCGEVFFSQSDKNVMTADLQRTAEKYHLSPHKLIEVASSVRVELKSVLYGAAEAAHAIANYITEMAATAYRRKELDKSRLSLVEEQMATARLEKALQEADFKLLQSQVNPHFLFNALSTVAQMAYMEGAEKAAGIIWSLSDLLRFTLRRTEEVIPLHEELKLLRDYVTIQQARFGDKLTVDWDVDPGLENALIPGMLLQPLVENSVIHGLEPLLGPGKVTIMLQNEGNTFQAVIEDNGVGFEPETVMEKTDRIGISSVRNRLQYYFADAFTFTVNSAPGKGTRIAIRLPVNIQGKPHA